MMKKKKQKSSTISQKKLYSLRLKEFQEQKNQKQPIFAKVKFLFPVAAVFCRGLNRLMNLHKDWEA